ncbi:MAG: 4Fe-4S dicluster domain-containing protein [Pseudomonadota bacterium]
MLEKNDYSKFIDHLRSWVLDLPDSESLVHLLEATLTVEEAGFLSDFPFHPQKIDTLAEKFGIPENDLRSRLDNLAERGIIFRHQSGDTLEYALNEPWFLFYRAPYWAGRRDEKTGKLARFANRYYYSGMGKKFGEHPTMTLRAIPIDRTIKDTRQVRPYENVAEFIEQESYICVGHCPCRQMKNLDPDAPSCKHGTFNCLHFGRLAHYMVKQGMGKEIGKEEAMEILLAAADAGLVHAISNTKAGIDSICNCCSCCCVFMQSANVLGLSGHQKSNYIVRIQEGSCKGCGLCMDRCPMKTIRLEPSPKADNKAGKLAVLEPERCIGCGVCVHKCPSHSLKLVHRAEEQDFPEDFRELNERRAGERGKILPF